MLRTSGNVVGRLWSRSAQACLSIQAPAEAAPAEVPAFRPSDYAEVLKATSELTTAIPCPPKEIGMTAGVPNETFNRTVRIYSPARASSQSGQAMTTFNKLSPSWRMEFTTTAKWENPLIGWTSSADPLENIGRALLTTFDTPEAAAAFATRQGWEYVIEQPNEKRTGRMRRYLGYGDNFSTKRKGLPDLSSLPSNRTPAPAAAAPKAAAAPQPAAAAAPKPAAPAAAAAPKAAAPAAAAAAPKAAAPKPTAPKK